MKKTKSKSRAGKRPATTSRSTESHSAAHAMKKSPSSWPVKVSNPQKVFWPEEGYTKLQLVEFYAAIFPQLQPYVKDRILSLERCPDGMRGGCFYQKEAPSSLPPGTPTKRIAHVGKSGKFTNYVVGGSLATQLALANLGCIAVHVAGSRASSLRKPDWVCFDLDPQTGKFSDAVNAATRVKEVLDALKLVSFPKTSGSRGLHIFIPIKSVTDVSDVLMFAETLVARVAAQWPKELTVEHAIAARTVVAPYSVRRRPKAPFSAPLSWQDVRSDLNPSQFNIGNYEQRLKKSDPWKDFFASRQSITAAIKALDNL
jgi:bifunctional non-homologous end joining protein LigD